MLKSTPQPQAFLFSSLEDLLDQNHPLYKLSCKIDWDRFENAYYQYFCGMKVFTARTPCNAAEPVHFRHRIGKEGMELILAESIRVNNEEDDPDHFDTAFIDSMVQEKNITYSTDAKLHKRSSEMY